MTEQYTQPSAPPAVSGVVAPPHMTEELKGATISSQFVDQVPVQSYLSSKASSKLVMVCKPITKAQLESEDWRPSYVGSREP